MSQMPDKIWLHKDTKYSTADTVCGYQYKFLAENEGIENFVEYVPVDAFIAKACEWLENHNDYICGGTNGVSWYNMQQLVKDFKKAMEE